VDSSARSSRQAPQAALTDLKPDTAVTLAELLAPAEPTPTQRMLWDPPVYENQPPAPRLELLDTVRVRVSDGTGLRELLVVHHRGAFCGADRVLVTLPLPGEGGYRVLERLDVQGSDRADRIGTVSMNGVRLLHFYVHQCSGNAQWWSNHLYSVSGDGVLHEVPNEIPAALHRDTALLRRVSPRAELAKGGVTFHPEEGGPPRFAYCSTDDAAVVGGLAGLSGSFRRNARGVMVPHFRLVPRSADVRGDLHCGSPWA
jgi:hypothetical protein